MGTVKIKRIHAGACPYCEGSDIDYFAMETLDEGIFYPAHCNECNRDFREYYDLEFSGMTTENRLILNEGDEIEVD